MGEKPAEFNANIEPEKVHTLIPGAWRKLSNDKKYTLNLGEQRTAFYTQLDSDVNFNANIEPEKIHTLIPGAWRKLSNDKKYVMNLGDQRTAFYTQLEGDGENFAENKGDEAPEQYEAGPPEKVSVLAATQARHHTTYYDKKNGLWRMPIELA